MALLVGDNTIAAYTGTGDVGSGTLGVREFAATQSGNATTLFLYISTFDVATALRLFLFDATGTLLASSSTISAAGAPGWVSGAIPSTAIASGTNYWIGCSADSYFTPFRDTNSWSDLNVAFNYASPTNIAVGGLTNGPYGNIAMYADGSTGGAAYQPIGLSSFPALLAQ